MAVTYVGHGTAVSPAGASGTCTVPAGVTTNDILVIQLLQGSTDTVTPPAGWAVLTSATESTNQGMNKLLWKRAGASEASAAVTPVYWAVMHAFRGCPTSGNPWDVFAGSSQVTTTALSFPSVTTTVGNTLIFNSTVGAGAGTASAWTNAALSSVTEVIDSPLTNGRGDAATGTKVSAGSTGSTTATLSASAAWSAHVTVAFKSSDVSGTLASTLPSVTSSIAGQVIFPTGTVSATLPSASSAFAGTAAPPSGPLSVQLPQLAPNLTVTSTGGPLVGILPSVTSDIEAQIVTATISGTLPSVRSAFTGGLVYGSFSHTLRPISSSATGAVNPIGSFSATLPKLHTESVIETRPHGSNVIIVEDEKRGFRITEDDMVDIYRHEASIFEGGVSGVTKYTLPKMTSNFGSNGGGFADTLPSVTSAWIAGVQGLADIPVTLRRLVADVDGLSGTFGTGTVGMTLPSLAPDVEGYGAVTWQGSGTYTVGTSSITPPLPTTFVGGDVLLLAVNAGPTDTVDTPAGWTPAPAGVQISGADDGTDNQLAVFYKVASFSDVAPTVTGTGDHLDAVIHTFRGADPLHPIDVSGGSTMDSVGTLATMPSVTTTGPDEMIVYIGSHGLDQTGGVASLHTNVGSVANLTERSDDSTTTGTGGGLYVYTGNINTIRFVGSDTFDLSTASARCNMTIAFKVLTNGGVSSAGGSFADTLPSISSLFAGGSVDAALVATLPSLTSLIAATANDPAVLATTLPTPLVTAVSATAHDDGSMSATLPHPIVTDLEASITVVSGTVASTLPSLTASLNGISEDLLKYVHAIGDGSTTAITVTHSLGTRDVIARVYRASSPWDEIDCDIVHTSTSALTVTFATAPATNEFNIVVLYSSV